MVRTLIQKIYGVYKLPLNQPLKEQSQKFTGTLTLHSGKEKIENYNSPIFNHGTGATVLISDIKG